MAVTANLRAGGIFALTDVVGRSLKAQMKYADKIGAKYTAVMGENEINENKITVKNMKTGESFDMSFDELEDNFDSFLIKNELNF